LNLASSFEAHKDDLPLPYGAERIECVEGSPEDRRHAVLAAGLQVSRSLLVTEMPPVDELLPPVEGARVVLTHLAPTHPLLEDGLPDGLVARYLPQSTADRPNLQQRAQIAERENQEHDLLWQRSAVEHELPDVGIKAVMLDIRRRPAGRCLAHARTGKVVYGWRNSFHFLCQVTASGILIQNSLVQITKRQREFAKLPTLCWHVETTSYISCRLMERKMWVIQKACLESYLSCAVLSALSVLAMNFTSCGRSFRVEPIC